MIENLEQQEVFKPDFMDNFYAPETYVKIRELVESVARPGMLAVEVGCYAGSSAFEILPTVRKQGGIAYLVDWFRGSPETVIANIYTPETYPVGRVVETLLKNLKGSGFDDIAVVVAASSALAARIVLDESCDYVMIAADHRYTAVKRDIDVWWPKVKPGGILVGHAMEHRDDPTDSTAWQNVVDNCERDYIYKNHYGVVRAVTEMFPEFENDACLWWVWKK